MVSTSFYKVKDNVWGQLDADIGNSDVSIALKSGHGARFPSSTDNDAILTLVKWDTSGTIPVISKQERVVQTNRSTDTLTVTRGYDSDTPQSFDADDYIYLNVTDGVLEQIQAAINYLEGVAIMDDGVNHINNNVSLKWRNAADNANVECLKLDGSNILQILTLPRLPSARAIAHDNDVIDKKYAADNFLAPPIGGIMIWGTDTAPSGWLLCYGQAVSRVTYADLFAVISTTYGIGDGSTTFNLPDLRGRFPLGQDDMGGASANRVTAAAADSLNGSGGEETHLLTAVESGVPAHTHEQQRYSSGSGAKLSDSFAGATFTADGGATKANTAASAASAHENMPPYLTLNYIIKT